MIKKITFEEVLPFWKDFLWPNRVSSIDPISYMKYLDGYNADIKNYKPTFFAKTYKGKIVGVNSGHRTSDADYRSRGLWVDPNHRKKGYGIKLLQATLDQAKKEGCDLCWSFPRQSSLDTYTEAGFIQTSDWTMDGEFGPNCYVLAKLKVDRHNDKF